MTKEILQEFNNELNALLKKYHCTLVPELKVMDLPTIVVEEAKIKEISTPE